MLAKKVKKIGFFMLFSMMFFSNSQAQQSQLIDFPGLNPRVFDLALTAYNKLYQSGYDHQQILTIVDYSKPSTDQRMWVINLNTMQVVAHTLVAHGMGSGGNVPDKFSNASHTHESSLGVFLTENTYQGKHGYSLRLDGLEPGINSNALSRDIVVHSAPYVSESFAKAHGRLGRSWGCLALNPKVANNVIQHIKGGTVVFAYYPNKQWLSQLHQDNFSET